MVEVKNIKIPFFFFLLSVSKLCRYSKNIAMGK